MRTTNIVTSTCNHMYNDVFKGNHIVWIGTSTCNTTSWCRERLIKRSHNLHCNLSITSSNEPGTLGLYESPSSCITPRGGSRISRRPSADCDLHAALKLSAQFCCFHSMKVCCTMANPKTLHSWSVYSSSWWPPSMSCLSVVGWQFQFCLPSSHLRELCLRASVRTGSNKLLQFGVSCFCEDGLWPGNPAEDNCQPKTNCDCMGIATHDDTATPACLPTDSQTFVGEFIAW